VPRCRVAEQQCTVERARDAVGSGSIGASFLVFGLVALGACIVVALFAVETKACVRTLRPECLGKARGGDHLRCSRTANGGSLMTSPFGAFRSFSYDVVVVDPA
jgi:hypothetical protein